MYLPHSFAKLDAGQPVNWSHPLNKGLLSWWMVSPLGHPSYRGGSRLMDLARRSHGTLVVSPPWNGARGRQGGWGSLELNTTVNTQSVSHQRPSLTACSAFSFCAWFLLPAAQTGINAFGKWDMGTGVKQQFARWSSGIQWFVNKSDSSAEANATLADSVLTAGGWNFCAFVADGSNLRTYYGAGIASGTAALSGPYIPSDTDSWLFGDPRGAGAPMRYSMDDAAYFGRALSAGEIAQRYELSRRGYPGLLNRVRRVTYNTVAAPAGDAVPQVWAQYRRRHAG